MMTNLMTILERKAFISSNPRIVLSSCPPPCGHFSIQESATGGLSYKVKKAPGVSYTPEASLDWENCSLQSLMDDYENKVILKALEHFGYNITQTAQALGLRRQSLQYRIHKYGIHI